MVSFEVPRTLSVTGTLILIAVVAGPRAGFGQPVFGPLAQEQRQIVEQIEAEQSVNGPHSATLIEPLTTLGLLYQESGDHGLAAQVMARAAQVVRANHGLRSLDQAPLIRRWIYNEEQRGNFAAAWDLEKSLLALAREHPTDLRTVEIFREIADRRMDILRGYLAGEAPPQIVLGCYYGPDIGSCTAGSRGVVIRGLVTEAQRHWLGAIRVLLELERYSSDELRELEMELARSSYRHGNYRLGRQSLRRMLGYEIATSRPRHEQVQALVQIADWDLLHSRSGIQTGAALDIYAEAYELLKRTGSSPASIEEIFSPRVPVVLPAFVPNPLATDEEHAPDGYIDVTFEITARGTSRQIEIIDAVNATNADKRGLTRVIARSRFRPRVTDGSLAASSLVTLRYLLSAEEDLVSHPWEHGPDYQYARILRAAPPPPRSPNGHRLPPGEKLTRGNAQLRNPATSAQAP